MDRIQEPDIRWILKETHYGEEIMRPYDPQIFARPNTLVQKAKNEGFHNFRELMTTGVAVNELIPNLLPSEGIAFLAGTQKHGKSYLAIDLAIAVASGGLWLGKFKPAPGVVLYLDQEARKGCVQRRIQWLAKGRGIDEAKLDAIQDRLQYAHRLSFNLYDGDTGQLRNAIERWKPRLVIIDSFIRVFGGNDERSNNQINQALWPLLEMSEKYGCLFLFLDHMTKPYGKQGARQRGGGDKGAIAETTLSINKRGNKITLKAEEMRDGKPERPVTVALKIDEKRGLATLLPTGKASDAPNGPEYARTLDALEVNEGPINREVIKAKTKAMRGMQRGILRVFEDRLESGYYSQAANSGTGKAGRKARFYERNTNSSAA
ncbi:MAG: hypothetical protein A2992_08400 [Elusimicrobia bacterium RIFCSPLOWO2_01_FULL_59_12]|nr:MAG: hypothetical protein A2992_08400 [Elusimicrobia bacterium RIFCSPLOWO2_01_FULL_59_12]